MDIVKQNKSGAKVISCGVTFITPTRKILLGKLAGLNRWDIPKGRMELGETPLDTAIREAYEETGFLCNPADLELILENYPFTPSKGLTLFDYTGSLLPDPEVCRSSVYSQKDGLKNIETEEFDAYGYFSLKSARDMCSDNMKRVLEEIFDLV